MQLDRRESFGTLRRRHKFPGQAGLEPQYVQYHTMQQGVFAACHIRFLHDFGREAVCNRSRRRIAL